MPARFRREAVLHPPDNRQNIPARTSRASLRASAVACDSGSSEGLLQSSAPFFFERVPLLREFLEDLHFPGRTLIVAGFAQSPGKEKMGIPIAGVQPDSRLQ